MSPLGSVTCRPPVPASGQANSLGRSANQYLLVMIHQITAIDGLVQRSELDSST